MVEIEIIYVMGLISTGVLAGAAQQGQNQTDVSEKALCWQGQDRMPLTKAKEWQPAMGQKPWERTGRHSTKKYSGGEIQRLWSVTNVESELSAAVGNLQLGKLRQQTECGFTFMEPVVSLSAIPISRTFSTSTRKLSFPGHTKIYGLDPRVWFFFLSILKFSFPEGQLTSGTWSYFLRNKWT